MDGSLTQLAEVVRPFGVFSRPAEAKARGPFNLLDTTDNGSHRGIEGHGQVYADVAGHPFGTTVTISTCEGSVDIEAGSFDDICKRWMAFRGLV